MTKNEIKHSTEVDWTKVPTYRLMTVYSTANDFKNSLAHVGMSDKLSETIKSVTMLIGAIRREFENRKFPVKENQNENLY